MKGKFLFLGTGSSLGVPMIGCKCSVCQSDNPKNRRLRPSALITTENKKFLIDIGPDFHHQALEYHIDKIDGLLLTHAHYDHTAGIDEIRVLSFYSKKAIPTLLSQETADELKTRFYYLFPQDKNLSKIDLRILPSREGVIEFEGLEVKYMSYIQSGMVVNGFCFGTFAYISDIREYSESIFDHLKGIETLVISALRYESSALHFSVGEAVEFIEKVGAKRAWLTHIAHELEHDLGNAKLPPHIKLAYDGLEIEMGTI